MAAKTKEVWAENPVEGCACVLPRRISNPLKDVNVEIGVSKRLAPGKSVVKSASWSDFAGAAAASKVAASEAGAARANKSAAEAPANTKTEARANKKSAAAEARANKKATKKANKVAAAAAAEAAAEKPYPFPVPSEEYFNLWAYFGSTGELSLGKQPRPWKFF